VVSRVLMPLPILSRLASGVALASVMDASFAASHGVPSLAGSFPVVRPVIPCHALENTPVEYLAQGWVPGGVANLVVGMSRNEANGQGRALHTVSISIRDG
jgi:hypothetical protein